jgi:hypothetical protein
VGLQHTSDVLHALARLGFDAARNELQLARLDSDLARQIQRVADANWAIAGGASNAQLRAWLASVGAARAVWPRP